MSRELLRLLSSICINWLKLLLKMQFSIIRSKMSNWENIRRVHGSWRLSNIKSSKFSTIWLLSSSWKTSELSSSKHSSKICSTSLDTKRVTSISQVYHILSRKDTVGLEKSESQSSLRRYIFRNCQLQSWGAQNWGLPNLLQNYPHQRDTYHIVLT